MKKSDRKKYVISFNGLFEFGYLRITLTRKTQTVPCENINEVLKIATKFRSKRFANLYCRWMNWLSKINYDLRSFKVEEYNQPTK